MIIGNTQRPTVITDATVKTRADVTADPNSVIRSDELITHLKDIANEYTASVKKKANAYADEKVAGNFDSDEELLRQAKESLDEIYGKKKEEKTSSYESSRNSLTESENKVGYDRAVALSRVDDRYDAKEERLAENLSKRGITHSSIARLAMEDLGEARKEDAARVNYTYDRRLDDVKKKIDRLTSSYEEALKNYEVSYALQLEKDIARLKAKRDRLEDEYAKEHSSERQKAYDEYLVQDKKTNADFEAKQGDYTGEKRENYLLRYNYLVGELKGKTAKSIASFLKNHEYTLKEYLGLYYDDFVKEVS